MQISVNFQAVAYLVSAILFIFALKGLTHPASARRGNLYGMVGMVIAVAATLLGAEVTSYGFIIAGVAAGAVIGSVLAVRIQMTAMPQLVAALHSFVGLAAVLVAIGTFLNYAAKGALNGVLMGELSAGIVIGAITFTGSVIAFGKLQGLISGKPVKFAGQHLLNAAARPGDPGAGGLLRHDRELRRAGPDDPVVVRARGDPDHPHRRGGHAGDHLHAEQLLGLGRGGDRLHPAATTS